MSAQAKIRLQERRYTVYVGLHLIAGVSEENEEDDGMQPVETLFAQKNANIQNPKHMRNKTVLYTYY